MFLALCLPTLAQTASPADDAKVVPDVLVFTNGDQLTGKLLRAVGGNVVFKSDMAGELTIPFDKIKQMRSGEQFAVLRKGVAVNRTDVGVGRVDVTEGMLALRSPAAATAPAPLPVKEVAFLVQRDTFERSLARREGLLEGWNGSLTAGATYVQANPSSTTYTAAIALVRAIPTVSYLPTRNRTTVNFTQTYGQQTSIAANAAPPPASLVSTTKTNILHGDAERDEYFSPRFFALLQASFDHVYSQGLDLQQVYGAGAGWTPVKNDLQQLDLKVDVHYEKQVFQIATSNQNLFGSTFGEAYRRNLPRKLVLSETANFLAAWNNLNAYSANVTATLAMPVFKRLGASLTTTDNYLNNPASVYSNRNSYQLVTGLTYTLH